MLTDATCAACRLLNRGRKMTETPIGIPPSSASEYWGPNVVRNILERPEFKLMGLCELDC